MLMAVLPRLRLALTSGSMVPSSSQSMFDNSFRHDLGCFGPLLQFKDGWIHQVISIRASWYRGRPRVASP
jgi:hypothetical protein